MYCSAFLAAALVWLCLVPAALAGTLRLEAGGLEYDAAAGEKDNLLIALGRGEITASEANRLAAGPGCAQSEPVNSRPAVRCALQAGAPLPRLRAHLGDRADSLDADARLAGRIDGGPGGDSIGAAGDLRGGPGNDRLFGQARGDVLRGGPGADGLSQDSAPGPARLYGGPGGDALSGSNAADVLAGGTGTDHLSGGGGRDVMDLGPGVDESGEGVLGLLAPVGDQGNDVVRARDGRFDYVKCGPGADAALLDRFDVYERDCERVSRRGAPRSVLFGAVVVLKEQGHDENRLEIDFTCPFDVPGPCRPTFLVETMGGRALRATIRARPVGYHWWSFRLGPRALRALSRWARITMTTSDPLGRSYRQTLVCPEGAEAVDPLSGEDAATQAPLAGRRSCGVPFESLDPWVS